jgi:N-acetylglucosaminyl-diphospho-decaprenol L-rhamnosyltransferase
MANETSPNMATAALSSEARRGSADTSRKPLGDDATDPVVISVIISTFNAREVVADCLTSIYRNPPTEPYEIVVVDDASSDGTSEKVRTRFPEVRLLINEVNLHYTMSNNHALDRARGEYIHLLNNDTIILPHAFDAMVTFLRNHPEAGAVGSKLLNEDGTVQWSAKSLPDLGSALFGGRGMITRLFPNNRYTRRRFLHHDRDGSEPFVAGYLSGASKMMPRKVIDEVGYLDSRMFYHVDADYCKRIAEAGYQNYYLPDATVIHLNHKGGTMVSLRLRVRSLLSFHVDCYVYYCKHMQRWAWSPMRLVILAAVAANFVALLTVQLAGELVGATRSGWWQKRAVN